MRAIPTDVFTMPVKGEPDSHRWWRGKRANRSGAIVLTLGIFALLPACSTSRSEGDRREVREGKSRQEIQDLARKTLSRYPLSITNEFGTSTSSAYVGIRPARVNDRPYGPNDGKLIQDFYSYLGISGPEELAKLARLVVVGEVITIGPPHFNSDDGGFWHPALHEEPGITDVASVILRDVLFRVDEVWATTVLDVTPGSYLTFLSPGGQVQVTLSEDQARQMELAGGGGTYIFSNEAPVDLVEGEEALLFLNKEAIDGLYQGSYAYRFQWYPAHELYYKYKIEGGEALNAYDQDLSLPWAELKAIVLTHLGRIVEEIAGPDPQEGTFPASPHPPVEGGAPPEDESEPAHGHGESSNP